MFIFFVVAGLAVLVCLFAVLRDFCFNYGKRKIQVGKLSWLQIVRLFNDTQMIPIEHGREWSLKNIVYNQRVYSRTVTLDSTPVNLYACAAKIKASSTLALSILRDFQRQLDWNVSAQCPVSDATTGSSNSGDQSQTSSSPADSGVNGDVIRQRRRHKPADWPADSSSIGRKDGYRKLSSLVAWCQTQRDRFAQQLRTIHRYWFREENGCCWLLEHDEETGGWSLNVMQPCTEGWFENKCILTTISCDVHYSLMAARLAGLKDLMALRRVQRAPITRLTVAAASASNQQQPQQPEQAQQSQTSPPAATTQPDAVAASKPTGSTAAEPVATTASDKDVSLLQRFKRILDDKKETYALEKRKKAQPGMADVSAGAKAEIILGLLKPTSPSTDPSATTTTSRATPPAAVENGVAEDAVSVEVADGRTQRNRVSLPDTAITSSDGSVSRRHSQPLKPPVTAAQDDNNKLTSTHKSTINSKIKAADQLSAADFGLLTLEKQIEEMAQAADTTVSCLNAEKANVSRLNVRSSTADQAKQSGGWTYSGLSKDVVVLRKVQNNDNVSMHSYLGKGIIPCEPKVVFDVIADTRKRIYFDELVTIDVISEIRSGMKIVYMQYEVSQLFKKDGLDFCVLQTDRQTDKMKYVVTMQSVHWADCPAFNNVARAKLAHSGWIIEPVMHNNNLHSMVTYISQMELGQSKSNAAGALDELASRQPLCIFHLRQYIMSMQLSDAVAA